MVKRVLAATLVCSLLPVLAHAQSLRASLQPAVFQQSQADWQREFDAAKAKKSSGKKKMLIGLGVATIGIVVAVAATDSCVNSIINNGTCDGSSGAATLGWIADLGGSGVFVWGLIDYFDGNGDMNRLAATKPGTSAAIAFGDHQQLNLSLRKGAALRYRVTW